MQANFIHLRLHTEYSLSDSLITIPGLMKKVTAFHMPAIAITDLSNMYATIKFYKAAMEAGIKPIIGVDIWIVESEKSKQNYRLTLLCQNNEGYRNLLKLISRSYFEGQETGSPVVQKSWLATYAPGLIALSGQDGDIGAALRSQDKNSAKACLHHWQSIFPSRFYLEISRVGKSQEENYIHMVLQLAESTSTPLVASNDVKFLQRSDFEAHEARVCIQQGSTLNDPRRTRCYTDQQYLRDQNEMQQLFADIPEALANTVQIAKRCNLNFTLGQNRLPHYQVPEGFTSESYLSKTANQGLEERLQKLFDAQTEIFSVQRRPYDLRLTHELEVINKMGFAGYFLIVADFIQWAKENNIPVGPGRGSGPGSLVAYTLKITDLDPLTHDLLFERFLNPERISMPDFDIDFCIDGRDQVIEYVMDKHGHDSVAQIITYGTMAAKAVVRDVGRVLGLSYGFVDKIAKLIPFELGITLDKAISQEPLLRERYEQEEDVKSLIDLARKLEGIVRNVGKHAGGIVIAPGKLTDFVPLYCEPNDGAHAITQYDKDDVEAVGLVKFDFLGLKTLTIIEHSLTVINKELAQQKQSAIDISLIPLNDPLTFKLLKDCQTTAIFQLESHGMRDLIKRLQPDCFEDLIALVALFRPGPLQAGAADDFINRKQGHAKIVYPHPLLMPILRPTYGAIVYQEQVMQIAQILAGYTLGSADLLRKAMGKKQADEMAKQREIFCKGAMEHNVNADVASHIFDLMEKFAGYGFNKSHSAAYALIAYQTAWLKAHYPAAFMSAVLSADMDKLDKTMTLLDECQSLKLHVSPPDINKSDYQFKVLDNHHIMYGLGAIKSVGHAAIENIIGVRHREGIFQHLFDFCQRVDLRKVNRRVLEALIKAGSFDSLGQQRSVLMASLDHALQQAEQTLNNKLHGQHDFLGTQITTVLPEYSGSLPWSEELRLQGEKETLGFYLSGHPLNRYISELANFTTCQLVELQIKQHQHICAAGIITHVRMRQTKKGDRIAILSIDDGSTQIEAVCFTECFQKNRSLINTDQLIVIDGEVSLDDFNNQIRIICRELYTIEQARERFAKHLQINLQVTQSLDIQQLEQVLMQHLGGKCPIVIRYFRDQIQADIKLGKNWLVKPSDHLLTTISERLLIESATYIYS